MKYINSGKINSIELNESNFFVLIDFDRAITKGESISAWRVLYNSSSFDSNYKQAYDKIHDAAIPSDIVSDEIKSKIFAGRFKQYMELLKENNFNINILNETVRTTSLCLRDGAKEFFKKMNDLNIPVIIISSSIGNVIEEYLKVNNCYYSNMSICANYYDMDNGKALNEYTITPYNKDTIILLDCINNLVKSKKYALLFRRHYRRYLHGAKR